MRKFIFIAAAATLALVVPASAQGVSIGVGDARVGVGVDRPHHDRYHERDSRAQYRDRDVVVIKKKRHIVRERDFDDRRSRKTVIIER